MLHERLRLAFLFAPPPMGVVDFNDVQAADVLALLRARPDLKIVGVNANNSAVTVLSGQVYMAERLEDVVVHLQAADATKEVTIDDT